MRTAYKCRAYPNPEQAAIFGRTFGCVRLVWNKALAERHRAWHADGRRTSYKEADAALTAWKKTENPAFLNEVSSVPLQQALRHQHAAFVNFFAGRARFPRFKNRNARQSAHFTRSAFRMRDGELRVAKTSAPLVFVWSFDEVDLAALDPTMVVISREPDGRWYVTFVARAHRKVRNARTDFLHRTSTNLVRHADTIVIEDLNVSGMVRNRRVARAISDCGWGEFRRQLEYKCRRAGRTLVVIDRWYPSSKICSACGHRLAELSLSTRAWTCPGCRTRHDRDHNAAKNILAAGRAVAGDTPGDVCGADVRRQGSSLPQSAVKQKRPRREP
ncbi:RNA-guided endonuclease TnpB family protein [Spirillospora sp. NPDC000708]